MNWHPACVILKKGEIELIDEEFLKAKLIKENDEFKKAFEEHQACENELEVLRQKSSLTERDFLTEKELKKKKLTLKDRMYRLMSEYAEKSGRGI